MRKINFIILIIVAYTFVGCAREIFSTEGKYDALNSIRPDQQVIKITSFGTKPALLNNLKADVKKSSKSVYVQSSNSDEFTEQREFESSESVALPELARYIYPGSLLMGNSIQNLDYKPIAAALNPITVSLSIPALNKKTAITINKPALSATRAAVQDYLQTADFTQNGQLSYSIEQFSSYDELKVAFGSDVNTRTLFGKNSSSTNIEEGMISKRTGFYVKFYQTSFTLDMDVPNPSLVADNNFDSGGVEPVYISSVSYGRMGVLAIETNETASNAKRIINETFNKLFYNKSTNFTQEEKSFIDGSDYNLYLIGGDGKTASQAFQGYEAFVNHVSQGAFSKSQPGVPIFCSYSYLKDNSPVKTKFIFDIKKPPLYVNMTITNIINGSNGVPTYGDINLFFYKSRSLVRTIANPFTEILIEKTTVDNLDKSVSKTNFIVANSSGNTSYTLPRQELKRYKFTRKSPRDGGGIEVDVNIDYKYKIIPNNIENYIILD